MSSGRSNLNINHGGPSVNFFGQSDPFAPRNWIKTINYIPEEFDISTSSAANTFAYGTEVTIELDKRGDLLGKIELCWKRGSVSGGTNPRFVDWEAPFSIEYVQFMYGNRVLHELFGDKLYLEMLTEDTNEEISAKAKLQHGQLSAADRISLNAAGDVVNRLDLRVPWAKIKKALDMHATPNKILMKIKFAKLATVVEADASASNVTASNIISDLYARCQYYHLEQKKKDERYFATRTPKGVAYKTSTIEYHRRETIANGSTSYSLKIRNIRNDVWQLMFVIRKKDDVEGANATGANPTLLQLPSNLTIYIKDNGTDVIKPIFAGDTSASPSYALYGINSEIHPKNSIHHGQPIFCIPFCHRNLLEMSRDDCVGSRAFAGYNNPELVLTFSALSGDHYIDVYGDIHNVLIQKGGDVRKYLGN
jgi:hypothetical protein